MRGSLLSRFSVVRCGSFIFPSRAELMDAPVRIAKWCADFLTMILALLSLVEL